MRTWRNSWAVVVPLAHAATSVALLLLIQMLDMLALTAGVPEMAGTWYFFSIVWGIVNFPNLWLCSSLMTLRPLNLLDWNMTLFALNWNLIVFALISGVLLWSAVGLVMDGCGRLMWHWREHSRRPV